MITNPADEPHHLTKEEQSAMHRALKNSGKIVAKGKEPLLYREAFEKWAVNKGSSIIKDGDRYIAARVHFAWEGWQAAIRYSNG